MKTVTDLVGQSFGRLTVLHYHGRSASNKVIWACLCSCGNNHSVLAASLKNGSTVSCGCFHRENTGNRFRLHGASDTTEYIVWCAMHKRCGNPSSPDFPNYGGRGISVCDAWSNFEAFLLDMQKRPTITHSIERVDGNKDYSPSNCVWATPKQQANNRSNVRFFTLHGRTETLSGWSTITGIKHSTLYYRLVTAKWEVLRALTLKL